MVALSGDKPIKCSDCFKKTDPRERSTDRGPRPSFGDRPKPRPHTDYTKQLESISAKMDKIIRLLETGSLENPKGTEGTEASRERESRREEKQSVDHNALKNIIGQTTDEEK